MNFVLHSLKSGLEINNSKNHFLNSFYVNYSNEAKLSEIIKAVIVVVLTKNELFCTKCKL